MDAIPNFEIDYIEISNSKIDAQDNYVRDDMINIIFWIS